MPKLNDGNIKIMDGVPVEFTRPMAQFLLGTTESALNLAGRERDIFIRLQQPKRKSGNPPIVNGVRS